MASRTLSSTALGFLLAVHAASRACAAAFDVDPAFDPGAGPNNYINAVLFQSSNRILIAGQFTVIHDAERYYVAWLKADGSPDLSTPSPFYYDGHGMRAAGIYAAAVQPDGKILLGGSFVATNQVRNLARLNADGSLDTGFHPTVWTNAADVVDSLVTLSDGSIFVSGRNTYGGQSGGIEKLNPDGSVAASPGGLSASGAARCMVRLLEDKILVGGDFTAICGVVRTNLARLNPDGSVDTSFSAPTASSATVYATLPTDDGKLVVSRFLEVARLHADGATDTTFAPCYTGSRVTALARQSDGMVLCSGISCTSVVRVSTNGVRDTSFNPSVTDPSTGYGTIRSLVIQPDGKILMAGGFATVNGVAREGIARINPDGTVDNSFQNGPSGWTATIRNVTLQQDGKALVGGWFQRVNDSARWRLARLDPDGTLDRSFQAGAAGANSAVDCFAEQADGRILVGGQFTTMNGVSRGRIARLFPDGSLDASFMNGLVGANGDVSSIIVQGDGKVVVAGNFNKVNNVSADSIARLNSDGTLATFSARITQRGAVSPRLLLQPDGKILLAGEFSAVNFTVRYNLARLNADGSLENGFPQGTWPGAVSAIALQSDGKVVIGGASGSFNSFVARYRPDGLLDTPFGITSVIPMGGLTSVAPQSDGKVLAGCYPGGAASSAPTTNLFRLNSNGTLDPTFGCYQLPSPGGISCIVRQPDGKFLIAGQFDVFNQTVSPCLTRIMGENAPLAIQTPPQSQTAEVGSTAAFTVLASGTPPLGYVWLDNQSSIVAAGTSSRLVLPNMLPSQGGAYHVVVTNLAGAVTSTPAMLSVIPAVPRQEVFGLAVSGAAGDLLNVDYTPGITPGAPWSPLASFILTNNPQYCFDLTQPWPVQRFYRASGIRAAPVLDIFPWEALVLTGTIGDKVRVDGINRIGPTDAWFTVSTVTLTSSPQLYLDTSAPAQPPRLYRLTQVP